jgi:dsDNA-specific endonuclease/ATPase MutS2
MQFRAPLSVCKCPQAKACATLVGVKTDSAPEPVRVDTLDEDDPFPDVVVVPFSDVVDLHSIPPSQVKAVVQDYLEEANSRGVRYLRIIHGRGIGVQREIVRAILSRTSFVNDFHDAPPEAGGPGATLVTLNTPR